MTEIRFKLSNELEKAFVAEQKRRKSQLGQNISLSLLVQEYAASGLMQASSPTIVPHQELDEVARQLAKDRIDLLELSSKAHHQIAENASLKLEIQTLNGTVDRLKAKVSNLKSKLAKAGTEGQPMFLGMTMKELMLFGFPTILLLFEKYNKGKAEEVAEELQAFKTSLANLSAERKKQALQTINQLNLPWPEKLKEEIMTSLVPTS